MRWRCWKIVKNDKITRAFECGLLKILEKLIQELVKGFPWSKSKLLKFSWI